MKIKNKLSISLISVLLIIFTIFGFVLIETTKAEVEETIKTETDQIIQLESNAVSYILNKYVNDLIVLQQIIEQRNLIENPRIYITKILENYYKNNPNLEAIWVMAPFNTFDNKDEEHINYLGNKEGNYRIIITKSGTSFTNGTWDGDWYTGAIENKGLYSTKVYDYTYNDGRTIQMISLSLPIETIVIGIDISIESLIKRVETIKPFEIGYALLMDGEGEIITHPNKTLIGTILKEIKIIKKGTLYFEEDEIFTIFKEIKIGTISWYIGFSIPYTILIQGRVLQLYIVIIGTIVISIIILIGIIYIVLHKVMNKPLQMLNKNFKEIAEGGGDLTQRIQIKSKDEIGEVANYFNKFIDTLQKLIIIVKKIVKQTNEVKINVSSSIEQTSAAIEEIGANIQSMLHQTTLLDDNVKSTTEIIKITTNNIENIDNEISTQASMVEESTAAITEMLASLNNVDMVAKNKKIATEKLAKVSNEGKEKIEETNKKFKEVIQYIEDIQEMVNGINKISAQTNLLSLNAAIESAHAGEYGVGFAVVADEIRILADTSAKSTKEISKLIKNITASVEITNKNLELSNKAFDNIENEVQSTVNAFSEIESSLTELNIGGKQILEATEEINKVTSNIKDISKNIKQVSFEMNRNGNIVKDISTKVTSGMTETKVGTNEIVLAMKTMIELSSELTDIINKLQSSFDSFKVES